MKLFDCRFKQVAAMMMFAILLSVDADIWLLDEPTANLDDAGRESFFNEIQAAKFDKIILLATNDRLEENICDEIIRLPLESN